MSKAAQLAQKSKIYIAGTAGAAINITAIAPGNPTIVTITGHGLANGDVLTIAGVTGADAALLNGITGAGSVVTNHTVGAVNDTIALNVDTTGKTLEATGTVTPANWTQITNVKSIKPGGATASKIDVTDLDSDAKEYETGLLDNGTVACDFFDVVTDPGQLAVLAAFQAAANQNFKVALTGGSTRTFNAAVLKFNTIPDAAVDGAQTGSFELQISGAVTRS